LALDRLLYAASIAADQGWDFGQRADLVSPSVRLRWCCSRLSSCFVAKDPFAETCACLANQSS